MNVDSALAALRRRASKKVRDGMARYAIPSDNALGVQVGVIRQLGKQIGRDQALSLALWKTGVYEARFLAGFVGDPARVTPAQMESWCRDFDSWAMVDTTCFMLFDRTPLAWKKIGPWSRRAKEFEKRAAFALLASLALHDKKTPDAPFRKCLPILERGATDDRNFVKKGVAWALKLVGRRSAALHDEAVALARRLVASDSTSARWVGRDALRDLTSPAVRARVRAKAAR
jgi:3-methyladenine DNA glycosylase AlkD